MDYRANFTNFVHAMNSHEVDWREGGKTSSGEQRFMHRVDDGRAEVVLPRELAHPDLIGNSNILAILSHAQVLGEDMVVHSLGASLADPHSSAQRWHRDQHFHHIFGRDTLKNHGIAGHDLPPHVMNMFMPMTPNLTSLHGPTEFCMGSGHFDGVPFTQEHMYDNFDDLMDDQDFEDYMELEERACPPQ
jgi:hypothetical protein